jgi:F-type H+-transporting ATPase subunit alpha
MALLGDGKSGKSSLATQIAINQRHTDITTIYVMISKRRADIIELIDRLEANKAMDKTIVIVATSFESLVLNYLAPYVGAAMGEYLWQHLGMDTLVVYDDLTSHAMAYREISLIAGVSPGRDSYPGDMFYTHSSLVERAGRLAEGGASQTIIPIVYAPGGDITAYLPTNVMSMTDGQWILDTEVFRETMRPAISTGLSVTRVGGVGQNQRQKALAVQTYKSLAAYKQAEEYAHFGSELSPELQMDLQRGKNLYKLFNQIIGETYSLMAQQIMLDIVLNLSPGESIDIASMKLAIHEYSTKVDADESIYDQTREEVKAKFLVQKSAETSEKPATPPTPPPSDKPAVKVEVKEAPKEKPKPKPEENKKDKHKKKKDDDHLHKDIGEPGSVYEPEEDGNVVPTKVEDDIDDVNKTLEETS